MTRIYITNYKHMLLIYNLLLHIQSLFTVIKTHTKRPKTNAGCYLSIDLNS